MNAKDQLTDTELNAYVDGELAPEEQRAVEKQLATDPEAAARVAEFRRLNDAIHARYAPVLDEPVPSAMQNAVAGDPQPSQKWDWRRIAAAVALLLAGGAAGYILRGAPDTAPAVGMSLVDNAVSAHAVYVSEVRHAVEVDASEEKHLVKWLTKRIGADVHAPALNTLGFTLLGGRLLPHDGGPAAQFMYENSAGRRLTIYVRRAGKEENTAFQFGRARGLSAFYWIDRPLAYALVGELSREDLLVVARTTYDQLN